MKASLSLRLAAALMGAGLACASGTALAHGNVTCNAGPKENWKSLDTLKAKMTAEGWKITKAHPNKDCYEVYGITPEGDKVESFWHPVTLEKRLVLRRGQVLYKAP
ncbi:PepSY domain-containing protein [Sphingobium sp. DEHP117]|uniref:PepSY domain-containing protein n=1 Tax=Sphingobium sp. DEHP117 TaxID=2993436 RepID=UPI0027D641FA|nr:PepSY domain-containing protein [Sphingobium sp. DEHP117]MDQ4420579.1 PepSY domain-containing protein [Sphingobium sp. DEHP117]